MIKDEFNQVEIKNENAITKVEFGKTQKTESTFQNDNKIPNGELNEKYIGKTVKKTADVNVEYTNKIQSNTATVVKGNAIATNAAASVSTVAVAATVAVSAVAAVTGVIVGNDYKYEMWSFMVSSNEASYRLSVVDAKKGDKIEDYRSYREFDEEGREHFEEPDNPDAYLENWPFVLYVYSDDNEDDYEYSSELRYGYNEGSFYDLTLGQKYNIVLKENGSEGKTIFSSSFDTYENSFVKDFYVYSDYDSDQNSFSVYLDYVDELNVFNDFSLHLIPVDGEEEYIIPLSKDNYQSVSPKSGSTGQSFNPELTYYYYISYTKEEEECIFPMYEKKEVSFYGTSEFYSVYVDESADLANKSFNVSLSYDDFYKQFSDFKLTLYDQEQPEEIQETISLEKKKGTQTVSLPEESSVSLFRPLGYYFTYMDNGEEKTIQGKEIQFVDNSGSTSEVWSVYLDKQADFINKSFDVSISFIDDLHCLSTFTLVLTDLDTNNQASFPLEEITNPQTISFDVNVEIDISNHLHYHFEYIDERESDPITIEGEDFYFENTAFAFESSFDFTHDATLDGSAATTGDEIPYYLPARISFNSGYEDLNGLDIELRNQNDEVVGWLYSEGDVSDQKWHYFSVSFTDTQTIDDIIDQQMTMVITLLDRTEERYVANRKDVKFTKDLETDFYDILIVDNNVTAGDYELSYQPIYSGNSDSIVIRDLVIKTTGNTYTYSLFLEGLGQINTINLSSPNEGTFDADTFDSELSNPVEISVNYAISPNSEDIKTIVCYTNFVINIMH